MSTIKDLINEKIIANGKGEITGDVLNEVLNAMVDALMIDVSDLGNNFPLEISEELYNKIENSLIVKGAYGTYPKNDSILTFTDGSLTVAEMIFSTHSEFSGGDIGGFWGLCSLTDSPYISLCSGYYIANASKKYYFGLFEY